MAVHRREVTVEELLRMPDDGFRYELVRGELRKMVPAGNVHGRVAMNFGTSLNNHVKAHDLGAVYAAETGFRLAGDPDTVRAPDVAFVGRERLEAVGEVEGYWPGAPDLAVEVISPGDSYVEVEEKVFDWLEGGTKMVVAVNPRNRSATVYRSLADIIVLTEADVLDGGDVLPGFRLAVREVFA
jgi:Uma2 family endonuclease